MENTIQVTNDYGKFRTVKGNREVNRSHLRHLETSILENNMLAINPIIVNGKMEVIDGQHRLEVAKRNNLPIYYVVVRDSSLEEVHLLNANNRAWRLTDYLESYCNLENPDYMYIRDFIAKYPMPLHQALGLLTGMKPSTASRAFKAGTLELTHRGEAESFGELLLNVSARTERGANRELVIALLRCWDKIEPIRLFERMDDSGRTIPALRNTREYLRYLEDIYNYNMRSEASIVRLF